METTNDSRNRGLMNQDDHNLSVELESLYHRVARLDESAVSGEKISHTQQHNQGNHDAQDFNQESESYRFLPNEEELMEKLMTIKEAYEKILTYWPYRSPELNASISTGGESAVTVPRTATEGPL